MMTGSEVDTTVEASIDTNMPSIRPDSAVSTWRCVIFGFSAAVPAGMAEGVDIERSFGTGIRRKRRRWRDG